MSPDSTGLNFSRSGGAPRYGEETQSYKCRVVQRLGALVRSVRQGLFLYPFCTLREAISQSGTARLRLCAEMFGAGAFFILKILKENIMLTFLTGHRVPGLGHSISFTTAHRKTKRKQYIRRT